MKTLFTFIAFVLISTLSIGQTTIALQDFDSGTPTWNYTATAGSGTIVTSTSRHMDGSTSLRLTGSNNNNSDPYVVFNNIDITGYNNVTFEIAFSASGPDGSDDLYLDISYDNGSTWNGTGSVKLVDGNSNMNLIFGNTNSNSVNSNPWTVNIADTKTQIKIRVRFDERSSKKNTSDHYYVDAIKLKGTIASSNDDESKITKTSSWSEPTNITYTSYDAANTLTTTNSLEIAGFTIVDGDGATADADAVSTILTDLSIDIDNWSNLKAIAIFDGTTNVGEITSMGATVDFSGLSITATDDATKDFTLRATFNTAVTDNQNIKYTISDATADGTNGSLFAAADASGAATDNTGDNNKIEVTADRLVFTSNKPPNSVTIASDFDVEVEAIDVKNNRDLDATNSITLAKASGTGTLSSATGLTQSLSLGVYSWTDVQYDIAESFTIEAQNGSLTNVTSAAINCTTGPSNPAIGSLYISEVSEGPAYKSEFIELYNPSNNSIDISNISLVMITNGTVDRTDALTSFTGDLTIPSKGYLVISRGNTRAQFESDWPSFPGSAKFIQGVTALYFATGTKRQWRIIYDDGAKGITTIDDSQTGVAGSGNTSNQTEPGTWTIASYSGNSSPGERNTNSELPIQLISFTAKTNSNFINLNWQTATEENNDYFTIERSYNAKDFEEVIQVAGAGNSNQILNYKYNDVNADLSHTVYYKLKQTDYDGKYTYSSIISVNSKSNAFEIIESYANNGVINISINSNINKSAFIELYDITGSLVYNNKLLIKKGINSYKINVSEYSSGVYFIRINDNNQTINTKLIIR